MIRTAALLAAIGTLLLGLMYSVNNVIPILRNLDVVAPVEATVVLNGTIVPALIWSVFFLVLSWGRDIRLIAIVTAVGAVAGPIFGQLLRELPTLSPFSVDSIIFAVTGVAYAAAWIWVLLLWGKHGLNAQARLPLLGVLALTGLRALYEGGPAATSLADALGGQLAAFWDADPGQAFWRLLAVPAIRVYYWFSQVLFVLAAIKKAGHPG